MPSEELVLPASGALVSLDNPDECAQALHDLRDLESRIKEAKAIITDAIVREAERQGTKTLTLADGTTASIRGGERTLYDAQAIEDGLRAAGAPEELIREVVIEHITYEVSGTRAKRAARANPAYAAVIEAGATTVDGRPSITLSRPRP